MPACATARLLPDLLLVSGSLRQILALHGSLLVIDTCSPRAETTFWTSDSLTPEVSFGREGEASGVLPDLVARTLAHRESRRPGSGGVSGLRAVAFCEGPGSVLGVRIAAATVRTWRALDPTLAVFSFPSLPLLTLAHPDHAVIADARRDTWHLARTQHPGQILRVPSAELVQFGALCTPTGFRRWSTLPDKVSPIEVAWSAADLLSAFPDAAIFTLAPEPEAFFHEAPSYVAWTPKIHQASAPPPR